MLSTPSTFPDATRGFAAQMDGTEARRQLRLAVGVVVTLSIAIVSAAVSVGNHPLAVKRDLASSAPVTVIHADTDAVGAKAI